MNLTARMAGIGLLGVAVAAAGGLAGGCVSYASYPPVPSDTATNNPNSPAMEEVMMAGLKWVTTKYPPDGNARPGETAADDTARMAINLPEGVKPQVYERIARSVGAGARPVTPENQDLPIYHVTSLRVRGDQANIWILRPVVDMGTRPSGEPIYQEVKLWLQGGLHPWRVVSSIDMSPDSSVVPPLAYYQPAPAPERRVSASEDTYAPRPRPAAPPQEPPLATAPEPLPPGGDEPPAENPASEPPKP